MLSADIVQRVRDLAERIDLHPFNQAVEDVRALAGRLPQMGEASDWSTGRVARVRNRIASAPERFDIGDLLCLFIVRGADELHGYRSFACVVARPKTC